MADPAPEIPGYAIERQLGAGAFGHVYLARETGGLARPVALKVFAAAHRAAYERELEAARRVEEIRRRERAPGIVQALGSGEHEGPSGRLTYLALEYLEAGSLADRVARSGPVPLEEAVGFARETATALTLLHAAGLFHRDVKPANLLVGADGHVRLGDFGLTRSLDGTLSAAGSPAFASPELIAAKPVSGELCDVYSLGATLAFLLTGETVVPGRPDVFAFERRGIPREIQRVLCEATAADPGERTRSAEAFARGLSRAFEEKERTNPGPRDVSSVKGDNMIVALETTPRPLLKHAVASFVCSLLLYPSSAAIALTGAAFGVLNKPAFAPVFAIPWILLLLAFVFGVLALVRIRASKGAVRGGGYAVAGIVIASLELVLVIVATVLLVRG